MANWSLVLSANVPDSRLAQITRDMSRDLNRAGISAEPIEAPTTEGARGTAASLGQVAIALIASGAVTALIGCLKAYLSRERTLSIKFVRADGAPIEITSHNVDTAAVLEALHTTISAKPG